MNILFNKKLILGTVLLIPNLAIAANPTITMKKVGNNIQVFRENKILYQVKLNPVHDDRVSDKKSDDAFMAGACLLVRRDVIQTELFPEVSQLEVYQPDGKRKIYHEPELGIRRIHGLRVLSSPNQNWSVIPDEEEGMIAGFFYISENCEVYEKRFPGDGTYYWGDILGGNFINESTLQLPEILLETDGQSKKVNIRITKDGEVSIGDL